MKSQYHELQTAIAAAFTKKELEQVIKSRFQKRLDVIADADGSVSEVVFNLLGVFERNGQLKEFVSSICEERPNNSELLGVCNAFLASNCSLQELTFTLAHDADQSENPKKSYRASIGMLLAATKRILFSRFVLVVAILLTPVLLTLLNLAPLWPDQTLTSCVIAILQLMILLVGYYGALRFQLSSGSIVWLMMGFALATVIVAASYWIQAGNWIWWNGAEEQFVTIGTVLTEAASQFAEFNPSGSSIDAMFAEFHNTNAIWTLESIDRAKRVLACLWLSLWVSLSLLTACALLHWQIPDSRVEVSQ